MVRTARYAALEPWWHTYTDEDDERARECLARLDVDRYAHRALGTLSSGEQQRVLLARAMMNDPAVVLLDEPSARLDLGGREDLLRTLADLATDEIRGGYEVKNGERVKVPGVLESFNLAQEEAELLILQARVAAGWIDASELPQPEPEYEDEGDYAEGEYDPDQVFGEAGGEGQASDDAEPSNT